MTGEIVAATARPMLHVVRSATMQPGDIARAAGDGFGVIGAFVAAEGITPVGAPLAVYRDWDGTNMKIEIGYPVARSDLSLSRGDVAAGETPAGKALMAVHRGAYDGLAQTYAAMEAQIREAGQTATGVAWEVYVTDPVETQAEDLVTEVYMLLE